MPTTPRPDLPFPLPDPDTIRRAIGATDERSRLLRNLLRSVVRLRAHFATADRFPNTEKGGRPNG
jgi:hypothetical protein